MVKPNKSNNNLQKTVQNNQTNNVNQNSQNSPQIKLNNCNLQVNTSPTPHINKSNTISSILNNHKTDKPERSSFIKTVTVLEKAPEKIIEKVMEKSDAIKSATNNILKSKHYI